MNNIKMPGTALDALGLAPRVFLVDHHQGEQHYHTESVLIGRADDSFVISEIIKDYTAKGYVVDCIFELLHGYTYKELSAMNKRRPGSAGRHMRRVYLDL